MSKTITRPAKKRSISVPSASGADSTHRLVLDRAFATASHWTFQMKPVKQLLARYISDGKGWADPYAGTARLAQFTNDLNPKQDTTHHLEAVDFAQVLPNGLNGVLFDPPYSYRQITEHYREYGRKASAKDTSYNFYRRVQVALAPKIRLGGLAISFGWNSNGFGIGLGFEKLEILLIAHGLHHNDTICVVERKVENKGMIAKPPTSRLKNGAATRSAKSSRR